MAKLSLPSVSLLTATKEIRVDCREQVEPGDCLITVIVMGKGAYRLVI